jgi:hypothetical protein
VPALVPGNPVAGRKRQPFHRPLHFIILAEQQQASAENRVAILGSFALLYSDEHSFGIYAFTHASVSVIFTETASELRSPEP